MLVGQERGVPIDGGLEIAPQLDLGEAARRGHGHGPAASGVLSFLPVAPLSDDMKPRFRRLDGKGFSP
jgi:hypothetical protein